MMSKRRFGLLKMEKGMGRVGPDDKARPHRLQPANAEFASSSGEAE